jgi:hypothetical protein
MSRPPMSPPPDSRHSRTPLLIHVAEWALAIATGAALAVGLALLVQAPTAGLDLTDEGLYLLSADNQQPFAGHNGWFGRYTGLLFGAVGYDIGWFRVAGVVLLAASGMILGAALIRWVTDGNPAQLRLPAQLGIVLGAASGALINYSLFIRTPGYNWLTLVGAAFAVAGILIVLTLRGPSRRAIFSAGSLIAVGCVLALWGKATAGIGLGLIVAVAIAAPGLDGRRARISAGVVALAAGAFLLSLHFLFIADPVTTIQLFLRSFRMVAVMDPKHAVDGATAEMIGDLAAAPAKVLGATSGLVLIGLAPLLLAVLGRGVRPIGTAVLVAGPVLIVALYLLARGEWLGGARGYGSVAIADLAVLGTAAVSAITATVSLLVSVPRPVRPPDGEPDANHRRRLAYGTFALLGATAVYAFGSANGFVAQTNGTAVLVLAAAGGIVAIPLAPRIGALTFSMGSIAVAVISTVILVTAHADPYRMAPLESATETIAFGPRGQALTLDPVAATYWRELMSEAKAACWVPGTRLFDLTWSPADAYALGATVPEVLIPLAGHFTTGTASAQEALRVSNPPDWAAAWLLTSPDLPQVDPASVMVLAGRTFPGDYDLIASLQAPGLGFRQELWRPADADPCPSAGSE